MSRAVRLRVLETSETACLGILARTRLGKRVMITSDMEESARHKEAHWSVESSCVMIAASMFVWNEVDEV